MEIKQFCYNHSMKKIIPSNKIYVSDSKIAIGERGVFAGINIKQNEIIEICPVIEFIDNDSSNFKEGNLVTFTYYFGKDKNQATILLGFGSIYNHSYNPNASYKQIGMTVRFSAKKNIKKDEEILVNYLQDHKIANAPLWFDIK
jgi:uncharacterized protein